MGTNFYLRCKTPREVRDTFHIAKTSGGWRPSFEANPEAFDWYDDAERAEPMLEISSVADIYDAYESGRYEIVDEYDETYTWEEFEDRVLNFCPDGQRHMGTAVHVTQDAEGYEFIHAEYR